MILEPKGHANHSKLSKGRTDLTNKRNFQKKNFTSEMLGEMI
jgi:hypothetical protein